MDVSAIALARSDYVEVSITTEQVVSHALLLLPNLLDNHLNNSENVPSLEVLPLISSHFPIHSE